MARAEALAKAQFAHRRDPHDCALMYVALKKKQLLMVSSLYTSVHISAVVGFPVNVKPWCVTVIRGRWLMGISWLSFSFPQQCFDWKSQ